MALDGYENAKIAEKYKGKLRQMNNIIHGDCLDIMKGMDNNSIDFIVTDPPYGLKFMNKKWDHGLPSIEVWKEALRICKRGSMMATFGGTRTYHRLTCAIEDAGWEIRDCIMWIYGSGFPKSHNHFGFEGYGTALKPAYEPIIIAMKPLDGTYAENAKKWDVGGINIDESRIASEPIKIGLSKAHLGNKYGCGKGDRGTKKEYTNNQGRWPANVIFNEEAADMLDEQSGVTKSKSGGFSGNNPGMWAGKNKTERLGHTDSGGASRFFYCAKASSKERQGSNHPTMKPISLMKYIITLLAPPNNPILLDPFCGSGSTLLAAKELGIQYIGIEKEKEYCEIAERRLANDNPNTP